jgi:uncharacterized glyoxalase superfamily protein PhnB
MTEAIGIALTTLPSRDEADRLAAEAVAAGARLISAGKQAEWGGYSGYFADPDGFRWEVAYNPDVIGQAVLDVD